MDFGNPKELRFFNDLRPIPGSEAFGRGGGGGGHIVTDFVTHIYIHIYIYVKVYVSLDIECSMPLWQSKV